HRVQLELQRLDEERRREPINGFAPRADAGVGAALAAVLAGVAEALGVAEQGHPRSQLDRYLHWPLTALDARREAEDQLVGAGAVYGVHAVHDDVPDIALRHPEREHLSSEEASRHPVRAVGAEVGRSGRAAVR